MEKGGGRPTPGAVGKLFNRIPVKRMCVFKLYLDSLQSVVISNLSLSLSLSIYIYIHGNVPPIHGFP